MSISGCSGSGRILGEADQPIGIEVRGVHTHTHTHTHPPTHTHTYTITESFFCWAGVKFGSSRASSVKSDT
jgi:hypothetical protein